MLARGMTHGLKDARFFLPCRTEGERGRERRIHAMSGDKITVIFKDRTKVRTNGTSKGKRVQMVVRAPSLPRLSLSLSLSFSSCASSRKQGESCTRGD